MERQHPPQGGEHHQDQFHEQQPSQVEERLTDAQLIHYGITEALREQRTIDDAVARAIAAQLHGGQASPLHALASSGALADGLRDELEGWRRDDTPVEIEPWLDALDEYLDSRDDPNPIEGWHQLWPTGPEREDDEPDEPEPPPYSSPACAIGRTALTVTLPAEQADDEAEVRHALFERISAASVTTLDEIATVQIPDQEDESDDFPWVDAATWSPSDVARENYEEPRHPPGELDALFGERPDEEVARLTSWAGTGWSSIRISQAASS